MLVLFFKKNGDWCIKQDDSFSKQSSRTKLFRDENFHLKAIVLSR